ncbi:GDSL-type esterase/lipase family protein [Agrilactobacillus fermenti]|uniref:GDSL-type esterase/lipase family protein n=1 Tax=Agrilactobacillus fermenti TaxID=2586909 RepID=UPI001E39166D|nr:GDSL-type esterase/lipase family protein [Agrilactobacillus fermenti]MCD2256549.1 lipase [Agrilactobacillus fermenti]
MKKFNISSILITALAAFLVGIASFVTTPSNNCTNSTVMAAKKAKSVIKQNIHITAIGDSLTQGVGDGTKNQGYVGLIKQTIKKHHPKVKVATRNFGVGGNTSTQILTRVKSDPKIAADAAQADAIILTLGGNDIMHVVQKDPLNVTKKAVLQQAQLAASNLTQIIDQLRQSNAHAPIFVFGIYNPFYVLLPTVTTMQAVVGDWNDITKTAIKAQEDVYFVSVDQLLSKGSKKTQKAVARRIKDANQHTTVKASEKKKDQELLNPYLYKKDHFHPNHVGYELMTNALYKVMDKHESQWLYQEQ